MPPADAVLLPEATPLDAVASQERDRCLNCGAGRVGAYCHGCGQHYLDDQLTIRTVWREFAERFLKLERGLPKTVGLALVAPGQLARRYVEGERRKFVNPVSFLLIGSALAVLLIPLYGSMDRLESDPMMVAQSDSTRISASMELGARLAGGDLNELSAEQRTRIIAQAQEQQARFMPAYLSTVQQLYSVFSVVLALSLAGALRLFFSGRERAFTYAETVVLGCYVGGVYIALTSVIASAIAPFAPILVGSVVSFVLLLVYTAFAAWGFYGRSAGDAALGAVSGLLAFVVYMVSVVVVAIPVAVFKTW